jgi:hypothetical protein
MPKFMIETTYRLPIFRQRCFEAETLEAASGPGTFRLTAA